MRCSTAPRPAAPERPRAPAAPRSRGLRRVAESREPLDGGREAGTQCGCRRDTDWLCRDTRRPVGGSHASCDARRPSSGTLERLQVAVAGPHALRGPRGEPGGPQTPRPTPPCTGRIAGRRWNRTCQALQRGVAHGAAAQATRVCMATRRAQSEAARARRPQQHLAARSQVNRGRLRGPQLSGLSLSTAPLRALPRASPAVPATKPTTSTAPHVELASSVRASDAMPAQCEAMRGLTALRARCCSPRCARVAQRRVAPLVPLDRARGCLESRWWPAGCSGRRRRAACTRRPAASRRVALRMAWTSARWTRCKGCWAARTRCSTSRHHFSSAWQVRARRSARNFRGCRARALPPPGASLGCLRGLWRDVNDRPRRALLPRSPFSGLPACRRDAWRGQIGRQRRSVCSAACTC